jgi:hypothetical protein
VVSVRLVITSEARGNIRSRMSILHFDAEFKGESQINFFIQ